ncbi:hypothetical protein vseg_004274 [Gypsophila vaccaria]
MASATVDPTPPPPSSDQLTVESIPTVDLRRLTQSELAALAVCSSRAVDLRRCDDVVIPKIDRTVFNESAGSRKQTYSRLRLAPRSNPNLAAAAAADAKPRRVTPEPPVFDAERAENLRIVSLFKRLFNLTSCSGNTDFVADDCLKSRGDELALVPVNLTYCDAVPGPIAEDRKRKRGGKANTESSLAMTVYEEAEETEEEEEDDEDEETRANVAVEEGEREREKEVVNRKGEVVDLGELGKEEDPYREELRRMTEGKETAQELLGFVEELEGEWGSRRRKRKIVDASLIGDALPLGWKILMAIKKKQGRASLFCRRFISPNGRYFVSCKEVSSYLISLIGPQESREQPGIQVPVDVASKNAVEIEAKAEYQASPDSSQFKDPDNRQMHVHMSPNQGNQATLSKDVRSGEIQASCASALKCHKCSTPFNEKDELLNHLISCHKRKRRKAGVYIENDDLMKDGKYECQFCDKVYIERSSYFGHVGLHVKNYVRSACGSSSVTPKKKTSEPASVGEVSMTVSDTLGSAELNAESVAGTQNILGNGELNNNYIEKEVTASPDAERYRENDNNDRSCTHQMELNVSQTDKALDCESSGKRDANIHIANNTTEGDCTNLKPNNCSASDKVVLDHNNNLCENYQEINATELVSPEVSKPPAVVVENSEDYLFSDSKQLDLGDDGSFVTENILETEDRLTAEFDLTAGSEEKSRKQSFANGYLVNKAPDRDCYDEEARVINNQGLTDGSGSGHIDIDMVDEDNINDLESLEESSAIPSTEKGSCGVTMNETGQIGSTVSNLKLDRGSETRFSPLSADQQTKTEMQNQRHEYSGLVNETEVDLCSLDITEVTANYDRTTQDRRSESNVLFYSKDDASNYIENEAVRSSNINMVQPSVVRDFQQFEHHCSPGNSTGEVLNKTGEEHTGNLFFTARSRDTHLDATDIANTDHTHNDVSDVLGSFGSYVEDKQSQAPKSLFYALSMNEQSREAAMNDVGNVSSSSNTMILPELEKVDSSRSGKLLDFSNMTEMNERFLRSVQHDAIPEETSPFQLWGQQSSGLEHSQTKVYGGGSGFVQQERASENNSLNLVGHQRPSSGGYNLNEVCMNEQRYTQRSKIGVFSRRNEARTDSLSHGNALNLAGFQQQCDLGCNLNKPSINQQSYGVQQTEIGSYSNLDQARQERVAYGNSLSLANVQQCDSRYSLNKACDQQPVDTGYSQNKGYVDSMQGLSRLGDIGNSRDRDLMIGFGNSGGRRNQSATTEFLWGSTEGSIMPGGLVDSSSGQAQSSGSFQPFDFLSDKGGNDMYTSNGKYDNMSSFEGLRSSVEPMEFSFMTPQESNPQLEHPKVLQYNAQIDQSFGSWDQKTTSLPNMMAGHVVSTLCVWCGNEFHQDSLSCEMQAGSIGYLCPSCKARMSGQFL